MLLSHARNNLIQTILVCARNMLWLSGVVRVEGEGYRDGEEVDVGDVGLR